MFAADAVRKTPESSYLSFLTERHYPAMPKSFYSSAIFLTAIYIALSLVQGVIFFQLGAATYDLPSFKTWSVFMYLVTLTWSLLILKYYYDKKYPLAFWTLAAWTVISLFQFFLFYNLLATRELAISYLIATLLLLTTGILYALSLIFSATRERLWLKTAGTLQLLLGATMILSFTWAAVSVSARLNGKIEALEQWITLVSSLIPFFFILNFLSERGTATNKETVPAEHYNNVIRFASSIAFVAAFFVVPRFAAESFRPLDDLSNINEGVRKMAERFEANTFIGSRGDSLKYRLMKPLDYDSTRKYPLVVCLHGSSAVGTDNAKQVPATLPAQLLSTPVNRKRYPAFLFVPQCPRGYGWGGLINQPSVDSLVFEAMAALEKTHAIDTTRRYVSGYSMGGYGAWHFISSRPEMFAAAVPMCGGGDPAFGSEIVDIPVWAFHGAKDLNVPVSETRNIIAAMKQAGGNPRYTEFPDAAHNIWAEVKQTTELPEWLFAQKRK